MRARKILLKRPHYGYVRAFPAESQGKQTAFYQVNHE